MLLLKLLLDMDPGVDDILALLFALRVPNVNIVGIGTSCGNVAPYQGALNALQAMSVLGKETLCPVCAGCNEPLGGRLHSLDTQGLSVHGQYGIGDNEMPAASPTLIADETAVEQIIRIYKQPSDVILVVTGPMTNIATALRSVPLIACNIPRIVLMGGAYTVPGNVTPYAEFNIASDPVAAEEIFKSGIPITAVGLDVTQQCKLLQDEIDYFLTPEKWTLGRYIKQIIEPYMYWAQHHENSTGCYLHDPLAMVAAIYPYLIWTHPYKVDVINSSSLPVHALTVIDRRINSPHEASTTEVAIAVNTSEFKTIFLDTLKAPEI